MRVFARDESSEADLRRRQAARKRSLHEQLGICINGPTPLRYIVHRASALRRNRKPHDKPAPGELKCAACKAVHRGSRGDTVYISPYPQEGAA